MRFHTVRILVVAAVVAGGFLLPATVPEAEAIPAFSRRYQTSCATCHTAYPKLNTFGEAFRNLGYRMPGGDEQFTEDEPVKLGADGWKRMWPDAIWPGDMPNLPPISLLVDSEYAVEPGAEVNNDFRFPRDTALLTGGNFGGLLSFFGRINLTSPGEGIHVHRLFGQLNKLFDTNLLNVRFGQMEPRAVPFSSNRRLTAFDYVTNTRSFPLSEVLELLDDAHGHAEEEDHSEADGHAHGGAFSLGTAQQGVEVWGVANGFGNRGGLEYGFGVVNGNGSGDMHENGTNDVDSGKDVYWRASYKIGGMSVLGNAAVAPGQSWEEKSVRIGTFGYHGSTAFEVPHGHGAGDGHGHDATFLEVLAHDLRHMGLSPHGRQENFTRFGMDFDVNFKDLNLFGAYLTGRTRLDPFILDVGSDFEAWFTQADYALFPWLIGALRYESVDLQEPFHPNGDDRWIAHTTALIRANAKVSFDVALHPDSEKRNQYLFRVGLVF